MLTDCGILLSGYVHWREKSLPATHGRRRNFIKGGKKIFHGGGLQKKTQGGGLFSKLRVWVGRDYKKFFLALLPFFSKNSLKNKNFLKNLVFFLYFLWVREGEALEKIFFSLFGGQFLP